MSKPHYLVKVDAYEGDDSGLQVEVNNHTAPSMWCVAVATDDGYMELIDNGYASRVQVSRAWPDAIGAVPMSAKLNHCQGSGASAVDGGVQGGMRRSDRNRVPCPFCGKRVHVTQQGRMRTHGTRVTR